MIKSETTILIAVSVALLSGLTQLAAAEASVPRFSAPKPKSHAEFLRVLTTAENGDARAQCMIADAYLQSCESYEAVPRSYTEAAKWYEKAAQQGYADACTRLGNLHKRGWGVARDFIQAAKYYRVAADQGDSSAQQWLSDCYRDGEGVPQDLVEAYKWMSLALAQMPDQTSKGLFKVQFNSLAEKMTPQQIALAQRLSTEFRPQKKHFPTAKEGVRKDSELPESPNSSGSGFFISDDGALVTNFHVVEGASRLVVKTAQGSFSANIVKLDPVNDIALLKVTGSGFRSLPLTASRDVTLGDSVFTIGFPNPGLQGLEPKLTDGKISSLAGAHDDARHFQISVAVQPGNSGGGLVNSFGNVVGVVTARLSDKAALDSSGSLPQNVNYALKSSYVLSLLESLPQISGKLKQAWPPKERKTKDVIQEAQDATALILAY